MRLDMFLKLSRIIPRRTMAKDACEQGAVRVNGATARASRTVAPGDLVQVDGPVDVRTWRVEQTPETKNVRRADAAGLVTLIETIRKEPLF